jgi:hypothetical protein
MKICLPLSVVLLLACSNREDETAMKERLKKEILEELKQPPGTVEVHAPPPSEPPPAPSPFQGIAPLKAQSDPRGKLPEGWKAHHPESGTGSVLVARMDKATSAKRALQETLSVLKGYTGQAPKVIRGISDSADRSLQAMIAVGEDRGLVRVFLKTGQSVAGVLLDRADRLDGSFVALAKLLGQNVPEDKPVAWHDAQNFDGSARLKLPDGWKVVGGQKGMVSAEGPHGLVDLGIWMVVTTPEAAAGMFARPPLVAAYSTPSGVVRDLFPQFAALPGMESLKFSRTVEETDIEYQGGKSSLIHFEFELQGKKRKALAYVVIASTGDGNFMYYSSGFSCPAESFADHFNVLLEIWRSWKVSEREYLRRMTEAVQSLKQAHEYWRQGNANAQRTMENANAKWSEAIRGTQHVRDDLYDRVREVPTYGMDKVIEALNREEGYERWRIIPVEELNR